MAHFVYDNVDYNVCILGESDEVYSMGIIVCSTNVTGSPEEKIQELTKTVKSMKVSKKASINLKWHDEMEDKSLGKL